MVIFDFDQTLVDTSPVEHLRRSRRWGEVKAAASRLYIYDGIHELISDLHNSGRPMAILTHSPDMVPRQFIALHDWRIPTVIGFHQLKARKPDPFGINLIMNGAGLAPKDVIHVGDMAADTAAARAAGVTAVGAAWGISDASELEASRPDHLFTQVAQLRELLKLA